MRNPMPLVHDANRLLALQAAGSSVPRVLLDDLLARIESEYMRAASPRASRALHVAADRLGDVLVKEAA